MLTKVELSIGNHRVGPGFFFFVGRHKGALELIAFGCGFDQGDMTTLVAVDEVSVDVEHAG